MFELTHSSRCILRKPCGSAGSDQCNRFCSSYIAIHGIGGDGGRNGAACIPEEYRLLTLDSSPARGGQPEVYTALSDYVATFVRQFDPDGPAIKSLYLYSREPGTGKTTTAAALLNEYLTAYYIGSVSRKRNVSERPIYFVDVNEWQTDYNAFNRPRVPESIAASAAERYYLTQRIGMSASYVVLDDIGVRDASEAFRADLHTLINARIKDGLPTIYTSNIAMSEMETLFDRRLADRIRDMTLELAFGGESKRGIR
ncbi:DNA replication protein [Paenibacillus sp. J5C_2022]|uniref:DNA replication protein n=1 Tax=Paenibacillus sp. J5C2022 TaxID=2977129 RepID=UPI0021CEA671|nr:DNA replication protein [Paenibacillus sp. J5C2022]MCU6709300.1 DNA replication protein [Paenibacillus sp. J5C2022]